MKVVGSLRKDYIHKPVAKLDDSPDVYRRDLLYNFVHSLSRDDLKEILELENMFTLLKGTTDDLMYRKVLQNKELSPKDLAQFKLLKEILVELHRLKHGQKNVNVNIGYKDVQDMMFREKNANP